MISYWGVDHGDVVSKIAVPTMAPKAAMVPKKIAGVKVGMKQGKTPTFRQPRGMSAPAGMASQRSVRAANAQRQGYTAQAANNIAGSSRGAGGSGAMPSTTVNLNQRSARNRAIAGGAGVAAVGAGGGYAVGRRNRNA